MSLDSRQGMTNIFNTDSDNQYFGDIHKETMVGSYALFFLIWKLTIENRIHIHTESARNSFYCLPRNIFPPDKHDINNMQTKDTGAKVG